MPEHDAWVGERLRTARLARGWSQRHLAEQINAGVRSVWRWENGVVEPRGIHAHLLDQLFADHPPVVPANLATTLNLQCRGCAELAKLVGHLTSELARAREDEPVTRRRAS